MIKPNVVKNLFLSLALLLFTAPALAQQDFIVEGDIRSLPDSTELMLIAGSNNVRKAWSKDGRFTLAFPITQRSSFMLLSLSEGMSSRYLTIWGEPGQTVRITGRGKQLHTWTIESTSPEQQQQEYFKQALRRESDERDRIDARLERLGEAFQKARSEEHKARLAKQAEALERTYDSLSLVMAGKKLDVMNEFEPSTFTFSELRGISQSIYGNPAYIVLKGKAIAQYERLPAEMKNSARGREIAVWLDPPERIKIGDPMAEAVLPGADGKQHRMSDYKGKYILLDFWSLACGPCLEAFPEMRELAEEYAGRLTIVGLSRDTEEQWKAASERFGVTWVNLHTTDLIWAQYVVEAMPHQVIISPEGIVLGSWDGYGSGHIREQLKKYLPEN